MFFQYILLYYAKIVHKKGKASQKGVPYKGFLEKLKIYRKLHFQAVKRNNQVPHGV